MNKRPLLTYSLALFSLLFTAPAFAKDQIEKKKNFEKTFQVNTDTELDIDNKFGKVEINPWDKNEFSIKVEMISKSANEERAQKILDEISVDFEEIDGRIILRSRIPKNRKTKNEEGFEINYVVYMPSNNPLRIKNSFGDVTMGNRESDLSLDVAYGSFKTGDIKGKTELKLSFGNGHVGKTGIGVFNVKYSEFGIEKSTEMNMIQAFSDIEIGQVTELDLTSKYGSLEIDQVDKIEAEAHFSDIEIEELTGSIKMNCSYLGNFRIAKLAKSFTKVDIDGKFGSYELGIEPGLTANLDAEFSFADLDYSSDVKILIQYQNSESNKSTYQATIGGGNPDKIIKINSDYGDLNLRIY